MQVYDLDKTQEWLNRTLAISKEPPLRGGVRTDHKARRQTALGVGVVALAILLFAGLSLRRPVPTVPPAQVASQPAAEDPLGALAPYPAGYERKSEGNPLQLEGFSVTDRFFNHMPQPVMRQSKRHQPGTRVPPPAPVWLDGK